MTIFLCIYNKIYNKNVKRESKQQELPAMLKKWWNVRHLCHYEGTQKQQTTFKDSLNEIASFIVQKKRERKKVI
jgi:hypothetical protein